MIPMAVLAAGGTDLEEERHLFETYRKLASSLAPVGR